MEAERWNTGQTLQLAPCTGQTEGLNQFIGIAIADPIARLQSKEIYGWRAPKAPPQLRHASE